MKTITFSCQVSVDVASDYDAANLYQLIERINDILSNPNANIDLASPQIHPETASVEHVTPLDGYEGQDRDNYTVTWDDAKAWYYSLDQGEQEDVRIQIGLDTDEDGEPNFHEVKRLYVDEIKEYIS